MVLLIFVQTFILLKSMSFQIFLHCIVLKLVGKPVEIELKVKIAILYLSLGFSWMKSKVYGQN